MTIFPLVPPFDAVRLAEHLHGHAGWLAAAALLHPAIILRNRRRSAPLAVGLAVAFVSAVAAVGVALYAPYRDRLKQSIFIDAPAIGWLFERKEHLAFGALVFAWAGGLAYAAAARADEPLRAPLRVLAHRAFILAAALAVVTAALGTTVAAYRSF